MFINVLWGTSYVSLDASHSAHVFITVNNKCPFSINRVSFCKLQGKSPPGGDGEGVAAGGDVVVIVKAEAGGERSGSVWDQECEGEDTVVRGEQRVRGASPQH